MSRLREFSQHVWPPHKSSVCNREGDTVSVGSFSKVFFKWKKFEKVSLSLSLSLILKLKLVLKQNGSRAEFSVHFSAFEKEKCLKDFCWLQF